MDHNECHRYEVEVMLKRAPSHGIAYNGFSVSHMLSDGSLFSGSYKFDSGIAHVNTQEPAELVIMLPEETVLEIGQKLELYNPIDNIGFTIIKKLLDKNSISKGSS